MEGSEERVWRAVGEGAEGSEERERRAVRRGSGGQ